ncbi:MAG: FAD-dependent thymidylate synthase [Candidatus Andersenbacteria bacterium]
MKTPSIEAFEPPFQKDEYSADGAYRLRPFFTNLEKSVYVPLIFSPEVVGALCSRTSRAADDLRKIFLNEYISPFMDAKDDKEAEEYGAELAEFIEFLHKHPIQDIFSNPRARSFYSKWLAQYGDDSIAQMAGMHVVFSSLSQLAIKHFEDQRIGLAPLEKSTRYVDYSDKVNGEYKYYTDPNLKNWKLEKEYREAMDALFDTYVALRPKLEAYLAEKFPEEKPGVVEKKAFDTLRGLLPVSTLSQVAFFGNGQAFEYAVTRSLKHPLGEVRWAGEQTYEELYSVTPSFLRRVKDEGSKHIADSYQEYIAGRSTRMASIAEDVLPKKTRAGKYFDAPNVELIEYDKNGEDKVIAGMLYAADNNHASWNDTLTAVSKMSDEAKRQAIATYLSGREQRWQKVGRAFENTYVRFDLAMNIGSWRDLHRHRMLTQQRQLFTTAHGYDLPPEIEDAGLTKEFTAAIDKAAAVFEKIEQHDVYAAQYAIPMAYRVQFQQWKNLRECFWEMELRTIPEGHPDYRLVEQMKFKLLEQAFPLITEHMHVNLENYDFARRGQEEKIQAKLAELEKMAVK